MANSSHPPHFFKIISTETIQNGSVKLPSGFVKEHGNTLSKYAYLQVSTGGLLWRVEVKRSGHRAWLHKRWKDFVEYYSIKAENLLVFRYEGGSRFCVLVFDATTLEIQYPIEAASSSSSTSKNVELDRSKDDDTDDDDELPRKLPRGNQPSSGIGNGRRRRSSNAAEKVLERAKAYKTPNPCFVITMSPSYVSGNQHVFVPQSVARSQFFGKKNVGVHLTLGEDGGSWLVKYNIGGPPRHRVRFLSAGWCKFVKENRLEAGDVCVFELVDRETMVYKVTIYRVTECE